jgi:hypothetical protein
MIDHYEILGAIAVAWNGPGPGDIQKLDRQSSGGSYAVLLDCALRVGKSHDGAEYPTGLAEYSMP